MPLQNRNTRKWLGALTVGALLHTPLHAEPARTQGHAPDRQEIAHALEVVRADPNLATERKVRTLQWLDKTDRSASNSSGSASSLDWILELIRWIAQSARLLAWAIIALLVALLVTFLIRLLRARQPRSKATRRTSPPSRVRDLDIRPESLPSNIGATARALWDAGDHRAALSLLYRGLLSRLAHVHDVPIRESSTEGDCLRLAAAKLRDVQKDYAQRLVQMWLQAVYGGQQPEADSLYTLCDEFAPALDAP